MRSMDIYQHAHKRDFFYTPRTTGVKFVSNMIKIFTACCISMFFLGSFFSISSGEGELDVDFQGQIMSAELQGVSLRLILERLEREKGIWFKGDQSALEESISVRFDNIPLHEGLRRILSNINHVLVFDQERGLVGLFILGKKDHGKPTGQDAAIAAQRSLSLKPVEEDTVDRYPFEAFSDSTSSGNPRMKP